MGRQYIGADQHFERKLRHDTELVPYEIRAEGDWKDCEALEVEGLTVSADYLDVSRVTNWRFERKAAVD